MLLIEDITVKIILNLLLKTYILPTSETEESASSDCTEKPGLNKACLCENVPYCVV